ncbi:hypothetical protein VPH35_116426 [Triticum aestivum]
MSKVDVLHHALVVNDKNCCRLGRPMWLRFFESHVENRDVRGPDGNTKNFLKRNITEESSKLEEDCFQIAFVIFMTGHILEPSCTHDYKSIDFWGALASTEEIAQFNYCEYVLQCFLDAVTKLKIDLENGVTTANLAGCHLFLQVFYLNNIDLGIFNMKHDVLPRFKEFDQDKLLRMTIMPTDVGVPEPSFWFINGNASISHLRSHTFTMSDRLAVCYSRSLQPDKPHTKPKTQCCTHRWSPELPRQPSALDYSNNIASRYPKMSSQPLFVLLREQNACAFRHVTIACHNIQNDMVTFTDKLMSALAASCTCCTARGLIDCPLRLDTPCVAAQTASGSANEKVHGVLGSAEASYGTPKAPKLTGVRLDLSDCEVWCFFVVTCANLPNRKYITSRSYASNPWFIGRPILPQKRNWIVHRVPDLIRITGHDIVQQLIGTHMIDHEVGSILIRWHGQLDSEARLDTPYLTHRHLL